ncbi:MAG: YggL family protein [Hyphomonas sp.]|nr:YggL family protein [Hyphomonas sp.]
MIKDTDKRTRRLRKKLRVDEFRIMGFPVVVSLRESLSIEEGNAFWDRFIVEAIELRDLQYGGLVEGYAMRESDVSATDEDREYVRAWLMSQPEVTGCEIGQLSDAYGARGPWFAVPPARQCSPAMKRRNWAKFRRTLL